MHALAMHSTMSAAQEDRRRWEMLSTEDRTAAVGGEVRSRLAEKVEVSWERGAADGRRF